MKTKEQLFTPLMRWFIVGMILANFAGGMYRMYLPIHMVNELGANVTQIGMIFFFAAIFPLVFQIVGGWISDVNGRLFAIFLGSIGGTVGYFLMIIAPTWQFMMAAIMIESISQIMVAPSFGPFLADHSTEGNRGKVFGTATTIFTIISVIAPPIGGLVADQWGTQTLMWVGLIPYTLSFILRMWMGLREFKQNQYRWQFKPKVIIDQIRSVSAKAFSSRIFIWVVVASGVADIFLKLSRELMPLFMERVILLDLEQIGLVTAMFGIATMLLAIPSGWLSDKFGELNLIPVGFLSLALGLICFIVGQGFFLTLVAWFLLGTGNAILSPVFSSLASKTIPAGFFGIGFGLLWTLRGVVSLPTSWVGGVLWDNFTPEYPFWLIFGLGVAFFLISLVVGRKFNLRKNKEESA